MCILVIIKPGIIVFGHLGAADMSLKHNTTHHYPYLQLLNALLCSPTTAYFVDGCFKMLYELYQLLLLEMTLNGKTDPSNRQKIETMTFISI